MNCKEFVEFLNAYAEGELGGDLCSAFERHIGHCPPCMQFLDGYKKTSRLARECCSRDVSVADAPEALVRAILAARSEVDSTADSDTES